MSLYDKAKELQQGTPNPRTDKGTKRTGVWEDAEEFIDKASNLGVVIRRRIRGRPEYSLSLVHFDDRGPNRYIPFPLKGLTRPLHEMVYLLMQEAEKWIEAHPLRQPRKDKGKGKGKDKRDDKRRDEQGGLSALAQKDAAEKGEAHVGKTERKRKKKTG